MKRTSSLGTTLAVAASGPFLVLIAFTVPLTTLTATATALEAGPGAQAWIMSAIAVGAATGLLGSGAIGDDHGRRRTFVGGALVLAGASAFAALAPTPPLLVLARGRTGRSASAPGAVGAAATGRAGKGVVPDRAPWCTIQARSSNSWIRESPGS